MQLARRPLHFFLLADCSGSMAADGKATALNTAVREMLPHLRQVAAENPHIELLFSSLSFSTGPSDLARRAAAHRSTTSLWHDLIPGGYTDMGVRALAPSPSARGPASSATERWRRRSCSSPTGNRPTTSTMG